MSQNYVNLVSTNDSLFSEYELHDYRVDHFYTIKSISVNNIPYKLIYRPGEVFNDDGLTISGIYEDEEGNEITKQVTGFYCDQNRIELSQTTVAVYYTENNITVTTYVNIQVQAATIIPPVVISNLSYNGNLQIPTINYPEGTQEHLTVKGTLSAINAGSYLLIFELNDGYIWSDTLNPYPRYVTWNISKASQKLNLSEYTIKLTSTQLSKDITLTRVTGDGVLTVTDKSTTFTSTALQADKIVVSYTGAPPLADKQYQNCIIEITLSETANYKAYVTQVEAECFYIPLFENASWRFIANVSKPGYINEVYYSNMASYYWDIGDCKSYLLNGQVGDKKQFNNTEVHAYIISFEHDGGTTLATDIDLELLDTQDFLKALAFTDSDYGTQNTATVNNKVFNMNHMIATSNGGWKNCDLRYDILGSTDVKNKDATEVTITNPVTNTFMAALPQDLRSLLSPMYVWTDNVGTDGSVNDGHVTVTVDYLPLLSAVEVVGQFASQYFHIDETTKCKQYEYYKMGYPINKYQKDNPQKFAYCWLRSPALNHSGDPRYFCTITGEDITISNPISSSFANYSYGISYMFLLKPKEV